MFVLIVYIMIVRSPVNQSTCARGTVNFTCVMMFTSGSPGPAIWLTNNGNIDASREPGHILTDDSNGRSAPANVTTVLTVTNVSISNNGADYICLRSLRAISDTAFLTVFGKLTISGSYVLYCHDVHEYLLRNLFLYT